MVRAARRVRRSRPRRTSRSTRALARLFTLAGMERYAEVCTSEETARILDAYAGSRAEGLAAYSRALATSHAAPPDTDLLAWSSVMGPEERAAYDACARRDRARGRRARAQGRRQRLEDQARRARRALAHPRRRARRGSDTWLSRISAERIEEWAHGHPGERSRLARTVMPKLLEPPDLPDEPLPTLAWLLGHASAGAAADRPALHRAGPGRRGGRAVRLGRRRASPAARPGGTRNSTSTRCTRCAAWRSTRWARCGAAAPPWC